jgi:hypothetical protein
MKLSSPTFDLSQFSTASGGGLVGAVRPLSTRLWVSTNQRSMRDWTKHPAENETRLQKQARPVLRLSIKATRIRRGSRRALRSDIRNTLGNILHAASLALCWAVASDMIDCASRSGWRALSSCALIILSRMGLRVQVQYRRISPIGELTSDPERAAMVRLVWSRIVRLPAEGPFRRLLKLLYSSIVPAGSTPFNGEPRDFGNSGATTEVRHRPWIFTHRIGSVPHRFLSRPPLAIAITTRISSGRGASAIETVIVSK